MLAFANAATASHPAPLLDHGPGYPWQYDGVTKPHELDSSSIVAVLKETMPFYFTRFVSNIVSSAIVS